MQIELKNVKVARFASEETDCFQATVYIDGAKAGTVDNDGHGGPHRYHPWDLQTRLNDHAKTLPEIVSKFEESPGVPFKYQPDADHLINEALSTYEVTKKVQRLLKQSVVFRRGNDILSAKFRTPEGFATEMRSPLPKLLEKWKADEILNLMPMDDAVRVFRQYAVR